MSKPRTRGAQFAVVPSSGNQEPSPCGASPAFDGTIASACALGIRLEDIIEMTRRARGTEPGVARFLDDWDALNISEQRATGTADQVCDQVGLAPIELLRIVRDVTCRIATYAAQIMVALSHPRLVAKTIDLALTATDAKDRLAAQVVLHKAMGFLPMPKGSQTIITIMQNAQTTAAEPVAAPQPEQTIRRLADRFNEARAARPVVPEAFPQEGNE